MNSPTNTETCKERLKKFTRNCRAFGGRAEGLPSITLPRSFPACMSVGLYFKSLGESPLAKISVDGSLPGNNKKPAPTQNLGSLARSLAPIADSRPSVMSSQLTKSFSEGSTPRGVTTFRFAGLKDQREEYFLEQCIHDRQIPLGIRKWQTHCNHRTICRFTLLELMAFEALETISQQTATTNFGRRQRFPRAVQPAQTEIPRPLHAEEAARWSYVAPLLNYENDLILNAVAADRDRRR